MVDVMISSESPAWTPSIYFTSGYGRANARGGEEEWTSIVSQDGRWQVPLLLRHDISPGSDACTPYGYGGIYASSELSREDISLYWDATISCLQNLDIVSVFFRFSPFMEAPPELPMLVTKKVGETYLVSVVDIEETWTSMKGNSRTAIRKARKAGFHGSVTEVSTEIADAAHPFRTLYERTMNRLDAADLYFFDDEYYRLLSEGCPLHVAQVTDAEGEVVAASIVLSDSTGTAHYHLAGSDPDAARKGANNLLLWSIFEWAHANGFSNVHLGGGVRPGDGLAKFKESFGGEKRDFYVGDVVVNAARYAELTERRAVELGTSPDRLSVTGFFPAYRVPTL